MCILGCIVNVLIFFAKLPEIQQVVAQDAKAIKPSVAGFVKAAPHTIFGALAEFAYGMLPSNSHEAVILICHLSAVGAQVAVASNVIFYLTLQPGISPKITNAQASNMFSGKSGRILLKQVNGN
jgi:FHS family L-fucose permease-like MFS transporter